MNKLFIALRLSLAVAISWVVVLPALAQTTSPSAPDTVDADGTPLFDALGGSNASVQPWEDYGKFIHTRSGVTAHGPDAFGDDVSLYNGALSFSVTDISLPGNSSLPVALTRTFNVSVRQEHDKHDRPLLDWDLDVPRISGIYGPTWPSTRCSDTNAPLVNVGPNAYTAQDYWQGLQADIPGGGELLLANQSTPKPSSDSYKWLTPGMTYIKCLPGAASDGGEGFLAITADGTKYTFDRMAQYYEAPLASPITPNGEGALDRRVNVMYATHVQDRFGHWVHYTYTNTATQPAKLTRIEADDGRTIELFYTTIGVISGLSSAVSHGRTWTYGYNVIGSSLTSVVLPDLTRWTINFSALANDTWFNYASSDPQTCDSFKSVLNDGPRLGTVTHPSGATAEFEVQRKRLGRSNVPKLCANWESPSNNPNNDIVVYPRDYDTFALTRKTVTGASLTAMEWKYDYDACRSWANSTQPACSPDPALLPCVSGASLDCAAPVCLNDSCAGTSTATVVGPDGDWRRHIFGNSYRYNEGKLLKVERGASASIGIVPAPILHTEETQYELAQSGMPFATPIGTSVRPRGDGFTSAYQLPRKQHIITRDGATFVHRVNAFDPYARARNITRVSSLGQSRTETMTYHDNTLAWVLGQVKSVTAGGVIAEETTFDPDSAQPTHSSAFGKLQQRRTYYNTLPYAGLVREVFDGGDVQKTTLGSYHRGLPQSVQYHDGTVETAVVNDRGEIDSVTDALSNKTCYAYDVMGRLVTLTHPSSSTPNNCNASIWTLTSLNFAPDSCGTTCYGLPAGHWKQTTATGNGTTTTHYDAFWRPVLTISEDGTDVSTRSFIVKRYDSRGREAFTSYPVAALNTINDALLGVYTFYDALDRVIRTEADSEHGRLVTTTEYLPGFQMKVTNPRGYQTTTYYQAYDTPSYDLPVLIQAPEGVTTTITRDVFGKPLTVTRAGPAG
jgi:hypothetical protein